MSEFSPLWGGNEGYGACDDDKQSAMGLSRDKNTFTVSGKRAQQTEALMGHF